VVHLLDTGADVAFVQDRLGHANIQNTMLTFPLCCFDQISCFFPNRTT
jgi:site-specific recombinase XerC